MLLTLGEETARAWSRRALVLVVAVHLVYPLLFFASLLLGIGSTGNAYTAGAVFVVPLMFLVIGVVVGPLVRRSWRSRPFAPWMLSCFVALESWLYWNGSRTESWQAAPTSADRFAFVMFLAHALATTGLIFATTAQQATRHSRRLSSGRS